MPWLLFGRQKIDVVFDFVKAKKTCRIMIIDDDLSALPLDELKKDGYFLEQITEVDANYMRLCEENTYDVIILDYNGVASKEICENDGFGVFERIRARNPNQYIVALSGQTFDMAQTKYLKNANDWLKKPVSLAQTKEIIDRAIVSRFDRNYVIDEIKDILSKKGISEKKISIFVKILQSSSSYDEMKKSAKRCLDDVESVAHLVKQISKIVSVFS